MPYIKILASGFALILVVVFALGTPAKGAERPLGTHGTAFVQQVTINFECDGEKFVLGLYGMDKKTVAMTLAFLWKTGMVTRDEWLKRMTPLFEDPLAMIPRAAIMCTSEGA